MTNRFALLSLALTFALLISGCGADSKGRTTVSPQDGEPSRDTAPLLGELKYKFVNEGKAKAEGKTLTGKGTSILFVDPTGRQDNRYTLTFSIENGGEITLVTNTDKDLKTGLKITLVRVNKSLRMQVESSGGGGNREKTDDILGLGLDATKPLTLAYDVHGHGHFVIVSGGKTSETVGFKAVKGDFAGLILTDATVTEAKVGKSEVGH